MGNIGERQIQPLEASSVKKACTVVYPNIHKGKVVTFVVIGVERGGTSAVSGVIRALGVDMGERSGRNHEDPKFLNGSWDGISRYINEKNSKNTSWGFKLPRASLDLDFYADKLLNPIFIFASRNIQATVDSWVQRGADDSQGVVDHALTYYSKVFDFARRRKPPFLIVNYERLCADPHETVLEMIDFIGAREYLESIGGSSNDFG